jgi:alkylation response protein AidB-like acyl-CoA dehydrogenase
MSTPYRAPVEEILSALRATGLGDVLGDLDETTVADVLAQFGRLASEVLAPTDAIGDRRGVQLDPVTGTVTGPPELTAAYRAYADGGWQGLAVAAEHGGAGFPEMVRLAVEEMFTAANMALSMLPVLSQDAIKLLTAWGSDEQRARYLEPLLAGRWSGTMLLTEPGAGSDVGALRTRAERGADGCWRLTGQKIFISWGEHELTENILHAVLARTPGAPPGTRGISLFLVPKVLDDGSRNGIRAIGLEHKLGLRASPTCVMQLDEAVGELVGEEQQGMRAMFTMMNPARISVGAQAVGVSERAYQQARAYAADRVQGQVIEDHPDVRRMLALQRVGIRAMRLLMYATANAADRGPSFQTRLDLLTPLVKAWPTDLALELTSLAIQVHGGIGYVEETGIAQRLRDIRITSIYEGTNGIQAVDLVTRKLPTGALGELLDELAPTATSSALTAGRAQVAELTSWLLAADRQDALAGATPFLRLAAVVVAGHLLAREAASDAEAAPLSAFFDVEFVGPALGLAGAITAGAGRLDGVL